MSRYCKPSCLTRGRLVLSVAIVCLAGVSLVQPVPAQGPEAPVLIASLSITPLPPSARGNHAPAELARLARGTARTDWPIKPPRRPRTEAQVWAKFEAEWRPEQWSPSPVKRPIEIAKYGADVTVFAVDRFVKNVRDYTDFEFDRGRLRRTRPHAREGFLDNPRVKLDLDLKAGKPRLGVRVVIPFGN